MNSITNIPIKALLVALGIAALSACQSESQLTNMKPALTSEQHDKLLIEAKQAILTSDISRLAKLSSQIDVNRPLPDNASLLAWAVETQDPKLVSLLLENGADANPTAGNRFTPIIQACRYGNSEIINALLADGANPDDAVEDGTTAFHLCAGSANRRALEKIASLGADIHASNEHGQTALMFAANQGNTDNLQYLVNAGANINAQTLEGYSPLFFAIKSQDVTTAQMAISLGADVFAAAKDATTAAQLAVYAKNFAFLTWYMGELPALMDEQGIDSVINSHDRDGYQLLHAAVKANQPELVAKLLALGANPNQRSEPSTLTWRYEANFKTENYIPPQLTPMEIAEQKNLTHIAEMLQHNNPSLAGI
ncbi:ankyrin repeat domain-containing protein [uncultured Alteromonas sp.]|jgi:ankyrin repeat protein|uniref:ankyrin repeat domain-containing protein n=1 Tax=uncultured Alteromonas sp. TaxID=179113 RepID=UPI0025F02502|nr:ankyrin repeat domain-containing protein [uncultured Alteromonas sp.]